MSREIRTLPVPEGLAGMRVDAALSKLLGISRTVAADLATDGDVLVDGATVAKSDRLHDGAWLEVTLPAAPDLTPKEELIEGMDILYSDADIIAVHKPVGVAAHPTVGWEGPTVVGGLAAQDLDHIDPLPAPQERDVAQHDRQHRRAKQATIGLVRVNAQYAARLMQDTGAAIALPLSGTDDYLFGIEFA